MLQNGFVVSAGDVLVDGRSTSGRWCLERVTQQKEDLIPKSMTLGNFAFLWRIFQFFRVHREVVNFAFLDSIFGIIFLFDWLLNTRRIDDKQVVLATGSCSCTLLEAVKSTGDRSWNSGCSSRVIERRRFDRLRRT